jgi:hypothetical protein
MEEILVPVSGMCRLIGVKRTKAFALIREKRVDSIKLGSRRLITVSSIEQLIKQLLEAADRVPDGSDTRGEPRR